jgi:GntR family transcriptional regulator
MAYRFLRVSATSGEPIYLQLVRQVKQAVANGGLSAGDRLPSVRALASSLVINPNTVARAYRMLEDEGLVESGAGRAGSFIAANPHSLGAVERRRRLQPYIDRLVEESRAMGVSDSDLEDQLSRTLQRATDSSSTR